MIYLASPYSADPEGNYARMVQVCRKILQRAPAPIIFCPVVHYHPIAAGVLSHHEMMEQCFAHLDRARLFIVVALDGWDKSVGVLLERRRWHPRPALLMTPDSFQGRSLLLPANSASSAPAELTTPIAGGSTEA
jgi:hypothetical protein